MIIGFVLNKIEAIRNEKADGTIQIHYGSKVDNVSEEVVQIYKDKAAKIDFTFTMDYSKDKKKIGNIVFSGSIVWKGELKEIMDSWKNKKLPENLKSPILNYIFRKCLINAVGLADSLGLPTPVPMPRIEFKNEKK